MSEVSAMQQKSINFAEWVVTLMNSYGPETEQNKQIQESLRNYFKDTASYNNFMFAVVPGVCNMPNTKQHVMNIRALKDSETRAEAVKNAKINLNMLKCGIEKILELPDDQLDALFLKFSLYVNLFTDMYVK